MKGKEGRGRKVEEGKEEEGKEEGKEGVRKEITPLSLPLFPTNYFSFFLNTPTLSNVLP
jgi:hypothetical protein